MGRHTHVPLIDGRIIQLCDREVCVDIRVVLMMRRILLSLSSDHHRRLKLTSIFTLTYL